MRLLRISGRVFLDALNSHPVMGANLCRMFAGTAAPDIHPVPGCDVRKPGGPAGEAGALPRPRARVGAPKQGLQLAGRFRQSDLADLLGATTRSIITILNAWRADGLVIYDAARAQLTLCREDDLQRLVGSDAI